MRNIKLSICINYNHHEARLIYIDGQGYALRDIETDEIYHSVLDFRNAYQPNIHLRNGQQLSNIAILLDDRHIGRYRDYKPLQNIHSMVCTNYPDDPESVYIRSLYDLEIHDLVELVLEKNKELQQQSERIAYLESLLSVKKNVD